MCPPLARPTNSTDNRYLWPYAQTNAPPTHTLETKGMPSKETAGLGGSGRWCLFVKCWVFVGVDVPDPPSLSMCLACLGVCGHRGCRRWVGGAGGGGRRGGGGGGGGGRGGVPVFGYRHPLGPSVRLWARFGLTFYYVWSAPAPLGFCAGGSCPFDGRT